MKRSNKKTKSQEIIRTDVWDLSVTEFQKHYMIQTVAEYRKFLRPLVLIINARWISLVNLTTKKRVNLLEKLIHKTTKNPDPIHKYFQKVISKYPSFRKFPSYLRRAAIADAIGIVSSFQTRYRKWQSGIRKKRAARPPLLTAMCNSYPALYKGQQVRYHSNYTSVDIKIWSGSDWIWLNNIRIKKHGLNRHLIKGNQIQSPALVVIAVAT